MQTCLSKALIPLTYWVCSRTQANNKVQHWCATISAASRVQLLALELGILYGAARWVWTTDDKTGVYNRPAIDSHLNYHFPWGIGRVFLFVHMDKWSSRDMRIGNGKQENTRLVGQHIWFIMSPDPLSDITGVSWYHPSLMGTVWLPCTHNYWKRKVPCMGM